MQTFVGLLVLSLALAANGASFNSRIVGGSDAPEGKYPYQVSMWMYETNFRCGGSIINERYVLTAAHCVINVPAYAISVIVGSNLLSIEGTRYQAEKLIVHSGFSFETVKNDVALIRLSEKIVYTNKIKPIALPTSDFTKDQAPAVLTGWGRLAAGAPQPDSLQEIDLKILGHDVCRKMQQVSDKQICTLTKRGEGACNGDSGGPLVAQEYVVGIVSYGRPCALGWPDVYTRVYSYLDWIVDHMDLE